MALVYRAIDLALDRTVALKVLRPEAASDPDSKQRFVDEARVTAKLSSHPNIVDVFDVGHEEDLLFLAMELHRGPTLAQLIELEGALPLPRAVRIIEQLASALEFAHSQGIVHRDIKPGNVMIGPEDVATLTDFGLAKALAQSGGRTIIGTVMGTPNYMSPEQVRGTSVGPPSDQYSLGITAFQMLSGVLPHNADSMATILYRHAHVELPVLHIKTAPTQSAPIDAVIRRATRKEPSARWPSVRAFADALEAAVHERVPGPMRRYAFVVPLALAVLVAVGALRWPTGDGENAASATPLGSTSSASDGATTSAAVAPRSTSSTAGAAATDTAFVVTSEGSEPVGTEALKTVTPVVSEVVAATDTAVGLATFQPTPTLPPRPRPTRRPTQSPTPTPVQEAPPREEPTNQPPPPPPPP